MKTQMILIKKIVTKKIITMKNIIAIILFTITILSCKAQTIVNLNTFNQGNNFGKYFKDVDNHFTPFLGTAGNLTFRVILYKTTKKPMGTHYSDYIEGRYLIIENAGMPDETILHNSIKYYPQSGQTSENVIICTSTNGISMNGAIEDNSVDENTIGILPGNLKMKIINTGSTTLQANWKVTKLKGMSIEGYEFNIPTDIILTKK